MCCVRYLCELTKIGQIFRDTQCTEKAPQPFIRYTCYLCYCIV
ncbi:hypothetical protein HMPREF0103_2054 [Bacteroides sp. 2_1_33B]|nr:hypothetical protein HMPREF0103_2054 [Bacteroides sp. 2_1_33B]